MNPFRRIKLGLEWLARTIAALPEHFARDDVLRREQAGRDEQEAERLDRIRNPHKYHCQ